MFKLNKLFNRKPAERAPVVGRTTALTNDVTKYQYGAVVIDGVRYCVRTSDKSEWCKGTMVEVLEENNDNGMIVLTVKKAAIAAV
jgi:hypothetical protein